MKIYVYKVKEIKKVVDGDTVDLVVDLGFQTFVQTRFRLEGYDAPETWRPKTEAEKQAGEKVKQFLEKILTENLYRLYIRSSKEPGIYGRYSAALMYEDDKDLILINEEVSNYMFRNMLRKEDVL